MERREFEEDLVKESRPRLVTFLREKFVFDFASPSFPAHINPANSGAEIEEGGGGLEKGGGPK